MTAFYSILLVAIGCVIGAYGAILLKKGADRLRPGLKSLIRNTDLISGLGLYGFSTIFYLIALRGGELSILYPMVSVVYIFTAILSKLILKEELNSHKLIGISLIIIGVILIGVGKI
jgi:drug/metabolite transporter (DMT)-like permease